MKNNILNEPEDEVTAEVVSLALQVIPGVGPLLSSTAMFFLEREKSARLNRFLIQISEDIKKEHDRINKDFIKTSEFRDLVENIFSKAAKTQQQVKLDAFRAIFMNCITGDEFVYSTIEEIIDLVQSWQSLHIKLIKILSDPNSIAMHAPVNPSPIKQNWTIVGFFSRYFPEIAPGLLKRLWSKLYVDGLMQFDFQPNKSIFLQRGVKSAFFTMFGYDVIELLSPSSDKDL